MTEKGAIKFAILHLRGSAHKWWHYGQNSLGLKKITTYNEFTQKLMNRFDQIDPKWYFQELTRLRQSGTVEEFASQFQDLSVMVPNLSQSQLTQLFIGGLKDTIKAYVKPLEPQSLEEAI